MSKSLTSIRTGLVSFFYQMFPMKKLECLEKKYQTSMGLVLTLDIRMLYQAVLKFQVKKVKDNHFLNTIHQITASNY